MAVSDHFDNVQKIYIAFYQRPADPAGLYYWSQILNGAGGDVGQVIEAFANSEEAGRLYGEITEETIGNVIDQVYQALFNRAPDAAGKQYYVDGFAAGEFTAASIVLNVLNGAANGDAVAIANKLEAANHFTKAIDPELDGLDPLATYDAADEQVARDWLADVTSSNRVSAAQAEAFVKAEIASATDPINGGEVVPVTEYTLTVGQDTVIANAEGAVFKAPIVQNQNGAVTNTLSDGDVLIGQGEGNTLKADLALPVTGTLPVGQAISANTNNIQVVELRAQTGIADAITGPVQFNGSHIDAENFHGVEEWWSVNSRANIQVEDVRTRPEDTVIGLRSTDPLVGFRVYFDPQQLTNEVRAEDSALTITLDSVVTPGDLSDVPVNGVRFTLNGESYTLQSDAVAAAATHAELAAALQAALAEQEELAGVTVTLNANNTITLLDPAGKTFAVGGFTFVNNEVPPSGTITWNQTVGEPELVDEPITTTVVLDNVGRTSQGGLVDIGSLGDGGIEQFNVQVGDTSWVSGLVSQSWLGGNVVASEHFLEVVNVAHQTGKTGDLSIGTEALSTDDRLVDGLIDIRELNAGNFNSDLKAGIVLTDEAIDRYLQDAEGVVEFVYTSGNGDDNITVDIQSAALAGDADFALAINLDDGDDRLNLIDTQNVNWESRKVSVDGGAGENVIEVQTSHGTNAGNTFANFANFQTYVVAGGNNTNHNFASQAGVEHVVVANDIGVNTTLINLEDGADISLNGKNQVLGAGNSNDDQVLGDIVVRNAKGVELDVSLDNAGRIDAELDVASLTIEGATSAVRTLNLASNGQRQTANEVGVIEGNRVNTFNITGTQDLKSHIASAANSVAAAPAARDNFVVDASALTGDLDLRIETPIVTTIDGTADRTNTFTGAAGDSDILTLLGEGIGLAGDRLTVTESTTISGFETIQFGEADSVTGFARDTFGSFNAARVTGVDLYRIELINDQQIRANAAPVQPDTGLELINLANDVNVQILTPGAGGDVTLRGAGSLQTINVDLTTSLDNRSDGSTFETFSGGTWEAGARTLEVGGYKTINLDLGVGNGHNVAAQANTYDFDLVLLDRNGLSIHDGADFVRTGDNVANWSSQGVAARELVLTGGNAAARNGDAGTSDSVDLSDLDVALDLIDLSGYAGQVTGNILPGYDNDPVSDVKVVVGGYDIDWTVNAVAPVLPAVGYNTIFEFAEAGKGDVGVGAGNAAVTWTIQNFIAAADTDGSGNIVGSINNHTILDLSDLGITSYAQLRVTFDGVDTWIHSETEVLGGNNFSWEIKLVGGDYSAAGDLGIAENFIFA